MAKRKTNSSTAVADPPKPRVHAFHKVVTRPNEYNIPAGNGKRVRRRFTEDDLKKIAENIEAQRAAGHKIAAPFKHYIEDADTKTRKLFADETLLDGSPSDRFVFDSSINAGYWKDARFVEDASQVDPSFKPGPALVATIEAPGDPNDPNTPAGKIGTSVQDTSIAILPKYTDGKNQEWDDFVAHIALPVHPIEPAQDNFALAMSEDEYPLILSMADTVPTPTSDPSGSSAPAIDPSSPAGGMEEDQEFNDCVTLLRSGAQIDLPPTTTRDNFIEVLSIALRQKVADTKAATAATSLTTQPQGSQARPAPVAMSEDNPPPEETMAEDPRLTALIAKELKTKKDSLKKRVSSLVGKGVFTQEYANSEFIPEIEALTMSADDLVDGEFPTPFVEKSLNHAEEAANRAGLVLTMSGVETGQSFGAVPDGANAEQRPSTPGETAEVPAEYSANILDRVFPMTAAQVG